jgi:hypothetical protein
MTQKRDAKKREKQLEAAASQIMARRSGKGEGEENLPGNSPLGLDVGTSKIVLAKKDAGKAKCLSMKNEFINVDYSKFTQGILEQNDIRHYRSGESLLVYGDGADTFANMMTSETRRPMRKGMLNPKEVNAVQVIKGIIDDLLSSSMTVGGKVVFSVPAPPMDAESDLVYHETVLKRYLGDKGYDARSINEGLAVVFSELEDENFTGFGISAGGGICNVCLAFLSVPVLTFRIEKGGDFIDDAAASVTGEVNTRVRNFKENELDLTKKPRNEIEDALVIYYDDLILTLVEALRDAVSKTSKIPKFDKPIQMVLSGGTVKPNGFRERFEHFLDRDEFPIEISKVRLSSDPLNATSKGALVAALFEE